MRILTSENIKEVERLAHDSGISYLQMMENAGSYCARIIRKTFENTNKRKVLIVCGKGKNGGDGFVIARKLCEDGYNIVVMMAMGLPSDSESSEMLSRIRAMGVNIMYFDESDATDKAFDSAQIIVDCVFGIGFKGEVDSHSAVLFQKINSSSATVISIDIPSGMYADCGACNESAVCADMTVAVMALKPVHVLKPSKERCGKVAVAPIGIPDSCFEKVNSALFTLSSNDIKSFFTRRSADSHKGTYGTVLVIGGSYEMPNAPYFAAQAAVNSGAGIVKIAFPDVAYNAIAPKTYEQILVPLKSNNNGRISIDSAKRLEKEISECSAVVIGCGMGVDEDTKAIVKFTLENSKVPVIIDADGINCVADRIDIIDSTQTAVILTPHPGEMSRLCGKTVKEIQADRVKALQDFARRHKAVLALKGSSTLVGSNEYDDVYVNSTGNPGMATGGSGDVLAGIIASFAAQGIEPFKCAVAAVYIHGTAGDTVTEKYSMMGNTPSLILKELPSVLKKYE